MIYTVTFNPAIDYTVDVKHLIVGDINRAEKERLSFGGKGVNVSKMLNVLRKKNLALGFVAGFTGDAIEEGVVASGVKCDFIHVEEGLSRINVKISRQSDQEDETEINGQGPVVTPEHVEMLAQKLDRMDDEDVIIIAGSVPKSLDKYTYDRFIDRLSHTGANLVVDAYGELLLNILHHEPWIIKPNVYELQDMFGVQLYNIGEVVTYARKLQMMGALNVLVSMGETGAVLVDRYGCVYRTPAPQGEVISTVGAGDAMLAGFVAAMVDTGDYSLAIRQSVACGSASAFSDGVVKKSLVTSLMKKVICER